MKVQSKGMTLPASTQHARNSRGQAVDRGLLLSVRENIILGNHQFQRGLGKLHTLGAVIIKQMLNCTVPRIFSKTSLFIAH